VNIRSQNMYRSLDRKSGKFNLIHYCDISTPAQQLICRFSGWHHRVNGKAGGNSLDFYRLVPLLLREADLVTIAVETGASPVTPAPTQSGSRLRWRRCGTNIRMG